MSESYRVELDVYSGPLDLLLRLVTREEVSIYDIPVARITDQYLAHLRTLPELDVETAGDFLVLAATLLALKARLLLPAARPGEEKASDDPEEDPRAELVRRLIVYRQYRQAAGWLEERLPVSSLTFDRGAPPEAAEKTPEAEPGSLSAQLSALVLAYQAALAALSATPPEHEVSMPRFNVEEKMAELLQRLERVGFMRFDELFSRGTSRQEIVATFLALLELVRLGQVRARQPKPFGRLELIFSGSSGDPEGGTGS